MKILLMFYLIAIHPLIVDALTIPVGVQFITTYFQVLNALPWGGLIGYITWRALTYD